MLMLIIINVVSGVATSGINLSIGNIGLKLAKKEQAIIYISARSMAVAAVSSIAPLAGGIMADFFASHQLQWNIQWSGPNGQLQVPLLHLHNWNFFFLIGAVLAMFALRLLRVVKEEGEVQKGCVIAEIKTSLRKSQRAALRTLVHRPAIIPAILARRVATRKERRGMVYRPLHEAQMKRA
jgi:MFS family permease